MNKIGKYRIVFVCWAWLGYRSDHIDCGSDIELLFRKFATDFAEKYRTKPVVLTDDAKVILLKYRFPGNIRQLKNLVDQISVLSSENKSIDSERLQQYIPTEATNLPALYRPDKMGSDAFSERDILYKVLFEMKRDVYELKKLVLGMLENGNTSGQLLKEHEDLFSDMEENITEKHIENSFKVDVDTPIAIPELKIEETLGDVEDVEDITHETEEEDLSLEKKEKELIIRALRRHNNKRKYAAKDLGISERTLYRKIKYYELES